jgi:trigger factor
MNITRQEVDAQNAVVIVNIAPADYQGKVNASLEKYRKTAKIPGFRPGNIPMAIIQKQVGKTVLAEELNKLTNDALYRYISEEKLEILGNPIPKAENGMAGNFDQPENFEFSFEIGYSPSFELPINAKSKFDYATVKIDKDLINKQVEDLRRRYGKLVSSDTIGDKDMVMGKFEEKEADGSVKAEGISHSSTISMEFLENKDGIKALKGKKVNEVIDLDPRNVSKDDKDCASLLGITEEQVAELSANFQFTIADVKRMEMADLNEELYAKLFADEVKTEEELHARISVDLERMFSEDTDRIFTRNVYNHLVNETKMTFPETFLKRWIRVSSEKPVTEEDIEVEFDAYLKSLKWQLIQTRIFKDNNIQLTNQEVMDFTKSLLIGNYAQYGLPAPDDQELTETAVRLLQNKEQVNGIYDRLAEQKLTEFFKTAVNLVKKEVKYDDFIKLASAQ